MVYNILIKKIVLYKTTSGDVLKIKFIIAFCIPVINEALLT
jgi:hypothetical protein